MGSRIGFGVVAMGLSILASAAVVAQAEDPATLQERALARLERYRDHLRKTGDPRALAAELAQAEAELSASYKTFLDRGELAPAALSLIKTAAIYAFEMDKQRSLYLEALELARRAGHIAHQAKALLLLGHLELARLGELEAARSHLEPALELSAESGDRELLCQAHHFLGSLHLAVGNPIAAAESYERALALATELDDPWNLYLIHAGRYEVFLALALRCEYETWFDSCRQDLRKASEEIRVAISIAESNGWSFVVASAENLNTAVDEVEQAMVGWETALTLPDDARVFDQIPLSGPDAESRAEHLQWWREFQRQVQASPLASWPDDDAETTYLQALLQEDGEAALALHLRAVEQLEAQRGEIGSESARGAFLLDKMNIYYRPILHLLDRGRRAEAFDLLERSKSRALADLLATARIEVADPGERRIYGEAMRLGADVAGLRRKLFGLRNQAAAEAEIVAVEKELQRLEVDDGRLRGRMAEETPRLLSLLAATPAPLEDVQRSMRQEGYEILSYLLVDPGLVVVWYVGADAIHVRYVFPMLRTRLGEKIKKLRDSVKDRNAHFDHQTAGELYLLLIAPVLEWVRSSHLVIIPHGELHSVPFQVFQAPDGSFLGERFEISYAPSASILMGLDAKESLAGGRLLAIANPEIAEAPSEVKAIAALYPERHKVMSGELAREADVKAWAGDYDLLHLSVHGDFKGASPLQSHLELAPGAGDDGRLTAAEMFALPLGGARLVVLSACETGLAEVTHANELLGMIRALLYAGAGRLVLTSWRVDAASTALWMETFYREVRSAPASLAARSALLAVKQDPRFEQPYYWGPFLVIGR